MKKLLAILLLLVSDYASASCPNFFNGTILTAQALNTALAAPCIGGGTIDGTPIGGSIPAAGAFTSLIASGPVAGPGLTSLFATPPNIGTVTPAAGAFTTLSATGTVSGAGITSLFASPPAIGGTTPAAGAFTTLGASGTVSGVGFTNYFASPPAIGGTAPNTGAFTTLSATIANPTLYYNQGATGAVSRTYTSRFQDMVNVRDFGADPTAATDSTAAIQAAINYVSSLSRGGIVHFPAGRYLVSSTITISSPYVTLQGDGMISTLFVTAADINTIIIGTNPITPMTGVNVLDIGFYHTNAIARTHPHLTGICLQQSTLRTSVQNGAYGISIYGGQGITFDRGFFPGNYSTGVNNSSQAITLRAASTLAGYTMGTGAVDLPTEVEFHGIYINGPSMAGWQYGVAIFAGEHITFTGDYYVGQSTINNIHIEQDANNKLILEVKLEKGGYIDAAGASAVWLGGPNGNGSQYIGSVSIDCDVKGQSGTGANGIYVDGTVRAGSFAQAVTNLEIGGHVSGFSGNGVTLSGGTNIVLRSAAIWGNSFNAINSGYGLQIGPGASGVVVTGGHIGGGTWGTGTGNQTAGVIIDPAAVNVTLNGVDLRGNQAALTWTPNSTTSGNRIINCPGFNGARAAVALAMAASGVDQANPYGAPAQVLVYGGTVSSIKLNGTQIFATTVSAPITVGPDDKLNVTYSVAPSWTWWPQ